MPNYYDVVLNTIEQLPRIKQSKYSVEKMAKPVEIANKQIRYSIYGNKTISPNCEIPQIKLIEGYFKKIFKGTYCDIPFFTKITKTPDKTEERVIKILRSSERGLRTETIVGYNGIRQSKLTKQIYPDGSCTYTRYRYNDKGTKPTIIVSWTEA